MQKDPPKSHNKYVKKIRSYKIFEIFVYFFMEDFSQKQFCSPAWEQPFICKIMGLEQRREAPKICLNSS